MHQTRCKFNYCRVNNNAAKAQDLVTAQIRHQQAHVKSGIAYQQLAATEHDLNGYTAEAGLKQQTWSVKLTNLELGLVEAHHLLTQKHAAVQALVGGNGGTVPALPTINLNRGQAA